ncbi:DUF4249 family protein [Aquimarina sp. 2201CG1-2-11]|uniref:DUF4249 family protein n=1 Tax=Aquimarina discodermiae TaxID=3231043 RepID=UPI0034631E3E
MKYFQNIVILLISIWLIGCETGVDSSDLLNKAELVVINGYLSPQITTLKVQVSKSKPRASTTPINDLVIKDATVVIADENANELELNYVEDSMSYEGPASEMEIIPGKKYFLKAMVNGKEYKSSCNIPTTFIEKIEHKVQVKSNDYNGNRSLKVTIEDIKDQTNFYIVGATVIQSFGQNTTPSESIENVEFELKQFATDVGRENSIITADGFFTLASDALPDPVLKIKVTNTEKILYEALRATFLNEFNDGDPFAEAVIAPTNIEGENGYGVFAGYQLVEKEITF